MSWDESVIHLFVAILVLESYEGRGVYSWRSIFPNAPLPFSAFKLFGKAQQTSRPTSTRTVLTGVLRRKSHAVCRMLGYLIIKNELVAMFFFGLKKVQVRRVLLVHPFWETTFSTLSHEDVYCEATCPPSLKKHHPKKTINKIQQQKKQTTPAAFF